MTNDKEKKESERGIEEMCMCVCVYDRIKGI